MYLNALDPIEECTIEQLTEACTDQRQRERKALWIFATNAPFSFVIRFGWFLLWWVFFALFVSKAGAPFFAFTMVIWRARWLKKARSLASLHALIAMHLDRRAPILYLRSFSTDLLMAHEKKGCFHRLTAGGIREIILPLTEEEDLLRGVEHSGPVVTLGPLGSHGVGASRLPTEDDTWKLKVDRLLSKSQLVILRYNNSPGLEWELFRVAETVPLDKIILDLPFSKSLNSNVAAAFPQLVDKYRCYWRFYSFDTSGQVFPSSILRHLPIVAKLFRKPRIDLIFLRSSVFVVFAVLCLILIWGPIRDLTAFAFLANGILCLLAAVWLVMRLHMSSVVGSRAMELRRSGYFWFTLALIAAPLTAILALEGLGVRWKPSCGHAAKARIRGKTIASKYAPRPRIYAPRLRIDMTPVEELAAKSRHQKEIEHVVSSEHFNITCECGRELPVYLSQAGSTICCACGARKNIPSIRTLRKSHRRYNDT